MSSGKGRRTFLQALAAVTGTAISGCGSGEENGPWGSGGSPLGAGGGGGAGGSPGAGGSAGSSGGTETGVGGTDPETATGGADTASGGQVNHPPLQSPLGIALLGLGKYARERLAPALQLTNHCRLKGIVTGTPSKVAMWQTDFGIESQHVYSYDNFATIADNPDIHVVYVVTPNHVHAQFAIAAARAKKHVWLEKPMAMTAEECQSIIDACNENGVKLAIGYRLQHEPNTQTVIGYASSKPYGAISEVLSHSGFSGFGASDANVWRLKKAPGGGALWDMGVYTINSARYASGEEPVRVLNARQWTERPDLFNEVDEWTEFELEFPSGMIAHCRTSFGENLDRLMVTCASGSYELSPMQAYTGVKGQTSDGVQLNQTIANQQAKQMDDDALSLIEGRPMLVPGEEGLRDVRIVQAIQRCVTTGAPVDIG